MDFQHVVYLFDEYVHHNVQHCEFELSYPAGPARDLSASEKKRYHWRQSAQALQSFSAIGKVKQRRWLIGFD